MSRILTSNDNTVLTQLFDPEAAPSSGVSIDPSLPEDPTVRNAQELAQIRLAEREIIKQVEAALRKPSHERTKDFQTAQQSLETLLNQHPGAASLLNDYAQVLRLQHGDSLLIDPNINPITTSKVLDCLNKAISLLTPPTPQSAVSPTQARTLAQAYTQRGALFHSASKALNSNTSVNASANEIVKSRINVPLLSAWTVVDLAEAASRDFFMGGRYGNEVARALAVHANPTAKLCGQMVREAMRREFEPLLVREI